MSSPNNSPQPPASVKWWRIFWFRGMINDVKRRAPYYVSDFTDAWDYRIVPSTIYMYFANILPALAFSYDMYEKMDGAYGVNEVLLASVIAAVVFSLLAAQPLCIVGVTGPITVFNYTVYAVMTPRGTPYFPFMCWICLWAMVMHWILAITNACNAVRWVTRFSCDIFGFYVAILYIQKGIQVLTLQWRASEASAYLSIVIALLVLAVGYIASLIGSGNLFNHPIRVFLKDYGTPLAVVVFTGFQFIGRMDDVHLERMPISKAFLPTSGRDWFVRIWELSTGDIFLAIPFAILLTILFVFDHNVSSLMAQGTEFPLKKPSGFHWDIFLLGLTTGISGILGLPAPNGLIPQAPFHTAALCVTSKKSDGGENNEGKVETIVDRVVEQRISNLAQGLLTLGTMTGPLLFLLGLIPQAVMAGLFFVMGLQALEDNGVTLKILYLLKDKTLTSIGHPLRRVKNSTLWAFVWVELVGFAATFAITNTIAAVGFPVIIFILIPIRMYIMPKYFRPEDLGVLDEPTASDFLLESVGGSWGSYAVPDGGPSPGNPDKSPVISDIEEDLMERGDSIRLQRRRESLAIRPVLGDVTQETESSAARGLQHGKGQ